VPRLTPAAAAATLLLLVPGLADAKPRDDRNHDRIPDRWERAHKLSTTKDHSRRDIDRDGLNAFAEWRSGTSPRRADSDRDGRPDGAEDRDRDGLANAFEVAARTDPGRADSDGDRRRDGREDADRDRLDNAAEARFGYAPRKADSDGDGVRDGDEGAGTVRAVDGPRITLALARGGTLVATLAPAADVACDGAPSDEGSAGDQDVPPEEQVEGEEPEPLLDEAGTDLDAEGTTEEVAVAAQADDPFDGDEPLDDVAEPEELEGDDPGPDPCAPAIRPGALVRASETEPADGRELTLLALELLG